jgi:hypothetical protein
MREIKELLIKYEVENAYDTTDNIYLREELENLFKQCIVEAFDDGFGAALADVNMSVALSGEQYHNIAYND